MYCNVKLPYVNVLLGIFVPMSCTLIIAAPTISDEPKRKLFLPIPGFRCAAWLAAWRRPIRSKLRQQGQYAADTQ